MSWYTEACPSDTRTLETGQGVFCVNDSDTKPSQCPEGSTEMSPGASMCLSPSGTKPKACPSGYSLLPSADPMSNEPPKCRKAATASCPAGSTLTTVFFGPTDNKLVCLKSTAPFYTRPAPTSPDAPWPCNANDGGVPVFPTESRGPPTEFKCYGSDTNQTTSAPAAPASAFSDLDNTYKRQVAAYEAVISQSIRANDPARIAELRKQSEEIQNTLNKMIENLTYLKKETPDIRSQRDSLLEKLRRIQRDYSAMLVNTDDLETLRRIREQENGEAHRQLLLYLMAFLFLTMVLLVYLMYVGRSAETTPTATAIPTMSPALT